MKNKMKPRCLRLWHGTSKTEPSLLYEKEGFNIAYSDDNGLWGRGLYFAINANYSCP
jgi:hypothetical protein